MIRGVNMSENITTNDNGVEALNTAVENKVTDVLKELIDNENITIPEFDGDYEYSIENKMKSVVSEGTDSSLETMLINYAKRIAEKETVIKERDTNRRLLAELSELGDMSDDLYNDSEKLAACISDVCGFKASVGRRTGALEWCIPCHMYFISSSNVCYGFPCK